MSQHSGNQWSARGQLEGYITTAEEMDRTAAKRGETGVIAPRESVQYVERELEVHIEHPGGGTATLTVCARRLWPGGIALLYPGYVHINSSCEVLLPRVETSPTGVEGSVRACRHVSGTIHDILIEFARQLEMKRFLKDPALLASLTSDSRDSTPLSGTIMYIGPNRAEQMLIRYHLQNTGAKLIAFDATGPALDTLRKETVQCVIVEFDRPEFDGTKLVHDLLEHGAGAAILALTDDPGRSSAARQAGTDMVINKPYERATLIGTLTSLVDLDGGGERGPIRSTLARDSGAREAIEAYTEYAGQLAAQIREAIKSEDFDAVRRHVVTLRSTGESFGFEARSKSGTEALTKLDASGSITESRRALETLISTVRRLDAGRAA